MFAKAQGASGCSIVIVITTPLATEVASTPQGEHAAGSCRYGRQREEAAVESPMRRMNWPFVQKDVVSPGAIGGWSASPRRGRGW